MVPPYFISGLKLMCLSGSLKKASSCLRSCRTTFACFGHSQTGLRPSETSQTISQPPESRFCSPRLQVSAISQEFPQWHLRIIVVFSRSSGLFGGSQFHAALLQEDRPTVKAWMDLLQGSGLGSGALGDGLNLGRPPVCPSARPHCPGEGSSPLACLW